MIFARVGAGKRLIKQAVDGHTACGRSPSGALGAFVDATVGGGSEPVVTPSLMTVTTHEPRKVVGTVNAAEFVVAVAASMGFLLGIAHQEIPWNAVLGLVCGGVLMAPIAARLAGRLPHAPMGTLVGGLIVLVNSVNIVPAVADVPSWLGWCGVVAIVVITAVVARRAWHRERIERAATVQATVALAGDEARAEPAAV